MALRVPTASTMLTIAHQSHAFMVEFVTTKLPASTVSAHRVGQDSTVTFTMPAPPIRATRLPSATRVSSMGRIRAAVPRDTRAQTVTRILTNVLRVCRMPLQFGLFTMPFLDDDIFSTVAFNISGSPCEHGGVCVNTPGSYRCDCPTGFSGRRCEVNINECESNPCQNEGTCIDERGSFRCICMPGKSNF